MRTYMVTYTIKANNEWRRETKAVEANNAKEACQKVKEMVKKETGRHTFRPIAERA